MKGDLLRLNHWLFFSATCHTVRASVLGIVVWPLNVSSCAPAHNTPLSLGRSPPGSFKGLLGRTFPSLCRQPRRLPGHQLPTASAAPVHSEIPNAKRVDLAARFEPHRRAARYNCARADDPDLARLRRDRGVPTGSVPQTLQ